MARKRTESPTNPQKPPHGAGAGPRGESPGVVGPKTEIPPRAQPGVRAARSSPPPGIDEDEEDDDDYDDDEDDEDDDDDVDASSLPSFPVANTNAALLTFLAALPGEPATAYALADWLLEQDDPRADHVRQLAQAACVIPEGWSPHLRASPMACGTWWCITQQPWCVRAHTYRNTPLYRLLCSVRHAGEIEVRTLRDRRTPERLRAAFERCRRELILAFFGTSPQHLQTRHVLQSEQRMDRVAKTLARCGVAAAPWLLELRGGDRDRFEAILARIWASPDLHQIGYAIMDSIDPQWRQRLASGAGTGPASGQKS